jgi:hypothetical protein
LRDIHRNPVKAGIVGEASKYRWSSYSEYIYSKGYFTDIDFVLGILNPNRNEAVRIFKEFMTEENKDECLDDEVKKRKFSDEAAENNSPQQPSGQPAPITKLYLYQKARHYRLRVCLDDHLRNTGSRSGGHSNSFILDTPHKGGK